MRKAEIACLLPFFLLPACQCSEGKAESDSSQAVIWGIPHALQKPVGPIAASTPTGMTRADFARHVQKRKETIPAGFHIVVQPPFVVIGDEAKAVVEHRANSTVKWAVDKLKAAYFDKDPGEIIDIWLFRDSSSYMKHTLALFEMHPHTPFGFYSPEHSAIIMNIATGAGTLVHEIVHPFVRANFPECPAWLNEGLGSLYEQCKEKNGRIVGTPNWRLPVLQAAITGGVVPTFENLTSTTDMEFYHVFADVHYAQARYLCYYLQEQGLLRRFYREFRKNSLADPTGFETLKKILGLKDMRKFRMSWERFVLGLRQ